VDTQLVYDLRVYVCMCTYMYVALQVRKKFLSKGWQTYLAVVNSP